MSTRAQTAEFLATPARRARAATHISHPDSEQAGRVIGPYRLLRELGRGGMGSVWLAERIDGLVKRPVALKLPHPGLAARGFAERLARERDILAALSHPHIARLYDAGVTADGQPFIALEYIEGRTILADCDAHRRSVRERVELFMQAAVDQALGGESVRSSPSAVADSSRWDKRADADCFRPVAGKTAPTLPRPNAGMFT